jgi:osmotically-inducible protein OsmY
MTTAKVEARPIPTRCVAGGERDQQLRDGVLEALRSSGYRPLGSLRCDVLDGVVSLSGVVRSYYLKQVAQTVTLRVAGIKGMSNLVEIQE